MTRAQRTNGWNKWKNEQDGRPNEELAEIRIETMNSQVRVLVQDFMAMTEFGAELMDRKNANLPKQGKVLYGSNPKTI